MKTCGIYKIVNNINGKIYIGQSVEIEKRWKRHINELNRLVHKNKHLERAWIKYGQDNFSFEIIEVCKKEELDSKERYWIKYYSSNDYNCGYNQDSGGQEGKEINRDVIERMMKNHRIFAGCENPNALLEENELIDIKYMLIEGSPVSDIAKKHNIGDHIVYNIRRLETYADVACELNELLYDMFVRDEELALFNFQKEIVETRTNSSKNKNYDEETIVFISKIKKKLSEQKFSNLTSIGKEYGLDRHRMVNIAKVKYYENIAPEYNDKLKEYYGYNLSEDICLTIDEIKEIKCILANNKCTNKELAIKYDIDPSVISNIKLLKVYNDIAQEYNDNLRDLYSNFTKRTEMSEELVIKIKEKLLEEECFTNKQLGKMFDVDASQISRIKNMKIYTEWGSEYNDAIIEKYNIKIKI